MLIEWLIWIRIFVTWLMSDWCEFRQKFRDLKFSMLLEINLMLKTWEKFVIENLFKVSNKGKRREKNKLMQILSDPKSHFEYFPSLSIFNPSCDRFLIISIAWGKFQLTWSFEQKLRAEKLLNFRSRNRWWKFVGKKPGKPRWN
jgi:hypothetical protein